MSCSSKPEDWGKVLKGWTTPRGYVDLDSVQADGTADLPEGWKYAGTTIDIGEFVPFPTKQPDLREDLERWRRIIRGEWPDADLTGPALHWYERGITGRALRFCFRIGLRPILQRTIRLMRYMIGFSSDPKASAPSS